MKVRIIKIGEKYHAQYKEWVKPWFYQWFGIAVIYFSDDDKADLYEYTRGTLPYAQRVIELYEQNRNPEIIMKKTIK